MKKRLSTLAERILLHDEDWYKILDSLEDDVIQLINNETFWRDTSSLPFANILSNEIRHAVQMKVQWEYKL